MSTDVKVYCPCNTCDRGSCEVSKKMTFQGLKITECTPDETGVRVTTSMSDYAGGIMAVGYKNCHFSW